LTTSLTLKAFQSLTSDNNESDIIFGGNIFAKSLLHLANLSVGGDGGTRVDIKSSWGFDRLKNGEYTCTVYLKSTVAALKGDFWYTLLYPYYRGNTLYPCYRGIPDVIMVSLNQSLCQYWQRWHTRIMVKGGGDVPVVQRFVKCDALRLRHDSRVLIADKDQGLAEHLVNLVQRWSGRVKRTPSRTRVWTRPKRPGLLFWRPWPFIIFWWPWFYSYFLSFNCIRSLV